MQNNSPTTLGNFYILKPRRALNKAFLKVKPNRSQIEQFKEHLIQLLDRSNETESEEFHKKTVLYPTDGMYIFSSNDVYSNLFLIGLLNSKLSTYLYRLSSMEKSRAMAQVKPSVLQNMPVSTNFNPEIVTKLEKQTEKIITTLKENPASDTSSLEAGIDRLVY